MKGAGMLVGNFELNPLRRPTWAWANLVLTLKETILLQCALGTDAIEYMNWVNKTNWQNIYITKKSKNPVREAALVAIFFPFNLWDRGNRLTSGAEVPV